MKPGRWLARIVLTSNELVFFFFFSKDLALINRAGGLYGRILTEVASTDRTQ